MKKSIGSGRGSVYNIILKALQTGDKYGYEICKEVEEKTDGAYILKQPSLYSGLKRLEAQGDISSYWKDSALGGRRHYYTLTKSGTDRINSSDFNWQDARDDIVGSLFEKSQLDSDIENAQNDIELIRSNSIFSQQAQQNIDEVLLKTKNLAENNQNEDEQDDQSQDENQDLDDATQDDKLQDNLNTTSAETVDENDADGDAINPYGDDLFSMFRTVQQTEDANDKIDDELNDDKDATQESKNDAQDDKISESNDTQDKSQTENDFASQEPIESAETEPEDIADSNEAPVDAENQSAETENEYLITNQDEQTGQDELAEENTDLFNAQAIQSDKPAENTEQNLDEQAQFDNAETNQQSDANQNIGEQENFDSTTNLPSDDTSDDKLSWPKLSDDELDDESQNDNQDVQDLFSDESLVAQDAKSDDSQNVDTEDLQNKTTQDENQQMDLFSFATNNVPTQGQNEPLQSETEQNQDDIKEQDFAGIYDNLGTIKQNDEQIDDNQSKATQTNNKQSESNQYDDSLTAPLLFDAEQYDNQASQNNNDANSAETFELKNGTNDQANTFDSENSIDGNESENSAVNAPTFDLPGKNQADNTQQDNAQKVVYMPKNNADSVEEYKNSHTYFGSFLDSSLTETLDKSDLMQVKSEQSQDSQSDYASNNNVAQSADNQSYYSQQSTETSDNYFDKRANETLLNQIDAQNNIDNSAINVQNGEQTYEQNNVHQNVQNSQTTYQTNSQNGYDNLQQSSGLNNTQNDGANGFEYNTQSEGENKTATTGAVDYRDIFGDLMSRPADSTLQTNESANQSTNNFDNINQQATASNLNFDETNNVANTTNNQPAKQELPRIDATKNINRTLNFDATKQTSSSAFEPYESVNYENPFEKYDSYQSQYQNADVYDDDYNSNFYDDYQNAQKDVIHAQKTSDIAFDKKYANTYNKFEVPDYEVRYFKKSNVAKTESKFISINKLNLASSFIFSILMILITTLTLVFASVKSSISGGQIFVFVLFYVLTLLILLLNFFKYVANKNKKVHNLNKNESMYNLFASIVVIILSISVNLFLGMNLNNVTSYLASLILPIAFAVLLLITYPIKKFLSKFSSFYN